MSDDRDVYSAANGFTDARQAITRALIPDTDEAVAGLLAPWPAKSWPEQLAEKYELQYGDELIRAFANRLHSALDSGGPAGTAEEAADAQTAMQTEGAVLAAARYRCVRQSFAVVWELFSDGISLGLQAAAGKSLHVHQATIRWAEVQKAVSRRLPRASPNLSSKQSRHEALARTAVQAARMLLRCEQNVGTLRQALADAHTDLARQAAVVTAVTTALPPPPSTLGALPLGVQPNGRCDPSAATAPSTNPDAFMLSTLTGVTDNDDLRNGGDACEAPRVSHRAITIGPRIGEPVKKTPGGAVSSSGFNPMDAPAENGGTPASSKSLDAHAAIAAALAQEAAEAERERHETNSVLRTRLRESEAQVAALTARLERLQSSFRVEERRANDAAMLRDASTAAPNELHRAPHSPTPASAQATGTMAAVAEVPWRVDDLPGMRAQIAEARDANVQLTGELQAAVLELRQERAAWGRERDQLQAAVAAEQGRAKAVEARLEGAVEYQGELARQAALTHRHENALHTVTLRETDTLHRKCEQADQRARKAREEAEDALRELHAEQAARAAASAQIRLLTARVRELEEAARTSASGEMAVTSAPALSAANSDLNAAVTLLTARCDRLQATLDQERADHEAATASAAAAAVVARADSVAAVQATAVLSVEQAAERARRGEDALRQQLDAATAAVDGLRKQLLEHESARLLAEANAAAAYGGLDKAHLEVARLKGMLAQAHAAHGVIESWRAPL